MKDASIMRISHLSAQAGLPVGTVKFYLRSGLLHPGKATSATQAIYNDTHLDRLRLIRSLLEVGKLSLAEIQRILDAIDLPTAHPDDNVQMVREAIAGPSTDAIDLTEAQALIADLGWQIDSDSRNLPHLARALAAIDAVGPTTARDRLKAYAEAAAHVARNDAATLEATDDADKARVAATSSVLFDSLMSVLRRLATENQAARQKGRVPTPRLSVPGL